MAAAHTAIVTMDGSNTLIRIEGRISLPEGPVCMRENPQTGEIVLSSRIAPSHPESWADFFALIDSREPDPEFMRERPMNRPPLEKKLFPDG